MYKVRAVITDEDNKILVVKQNSSKNKEVWTFPGGKSKYRNSLYLRYILKKKVKQKTGLKIKIKNMVQISGNLYVMNCDVRGGRLHIDRDNPKNVDVLEIKWVSRGDKELQYKYNKHVVDEILK